MDLSEKLLKLSDLHAQGALTDEEFAAAKARLIAGARSQDNSLGRAANRAVSMWVILSILGLIVFVVMMGKMLDHQRQPNWQRDLPKIEIPSLPPVTLPADSR
ncbi:MAG: SHOCT domain-containing protein [Planctomycetota bacterium]|nr:SHOCT domain-containing protein [Planctomycetota bacterium]